MNVVDISRNGSGGGRDVGGTIKDPRDIPQPIKYESKVACVATLLRRLDTIAPTYNKNYTASINYAADYNSWLMATGFFSTTNAEKQYMGGCGDRTFEVSRTTTWTTDEGSVVVVGNGYGPSLKLARNHSAYIVWYNLRNIIPRVQMDYPPESNQDDTSDIFDRYCRIVRGYEYERRTSFAKRYFDDPRVQMETPSKESEQGDTTQQSEQQSNTIITRDQQEAVQKPSMALDVAEDIVSSENYHRFPGVTQRWMPIKQVPITTSAQYNNIVTAVSLPEDLFGTNCSPSLIPFETFIYGRMDIEIKAVVNSNKFACGKLVMSSKYDTYQAENVQKGTQSALARNHVILDLSTNNEGCLTIPFRYHRPLVRLVKSDGSTQGVRPSKYATVYLHVLSTLQTGPGGPSDINLTLFYRLKASQFTGMSYRASVQGVGLEDVITPKTSQALKEVLKGAEKAFDQLGSSRDQDKPGTIASTNVVPHPRMNFATGKGVTDVLPLRVNPHTLTNYTKVNIPIDEPKSFDELSRIWGLYKAFTWDNTSAAGSEIAKFVVDPTCRSYSENYTGELTPLEYSMENFAFWSGPIELRLDFVSNAFHTGTVQLSAEFGRVTASATPCESESTYTKTFHLGDQKTVSFVVPYIYDTVMRRTTGNVCNPYLNAASDDTISKSAASLAPLSRTVFKVRVINPLRPVSSVPQKIEVLIFMRAGENFGMHGLKGGTLYQSTSGNQIDQFPFSYNEPPGLKADRQAKYDKDLAPLTNVKQRASLKTHFENNEKRYVDKKWNERVTVQMDTGDKENQDTTDNFSQGVAGNRIVQTLDNHMSFKDLLRRPTLLMWKQKITANTAASCTSFMVPLKPPSRAMYGNTTIDNTSVWASTLHQTSAAMIMDMFRVWRGSMRFTINVHTTSARPVYVSLIPHSGVRMIGNHELTVNGKYPIPGMNFVTELIVPSVNPSMTIEAPYETENTWTLTWDEDPTMNYTWRDKGDDNAGHLAITAHEDIIVDIWWSAGDDFEFANFYGIPDATTSGHRYRLADAPQVQMDFGLTEAVTKVTALTKSMMPIMSRAAVATIPIIGQPLVVAEAATNLQRNVDTVAGNMSQTLHKIDVLADHLGATSFEITHIVEQAVTSVSSMISGLVHGTVLIYDFIIDVMIAWMEKSWRVVGVGIVRFLSKLFCKGADLYALVMQYGRDLGSFIERLFAEEAPRVQYDPDNQSITLVGILLGLVGTMTGVSMDISPGRYTGFFEGMTRRLTTSGGVSYLFIVLRYVQTIFSTVKEMIMWALGYANPEAAALKLLSRDKEFIAKFVHEAQLITSEVNAMLINSPLHRQRYWATVLQAYKIQKILAQAPSNVVSVQLSKLVTDVISKGNEKFLDLSASPVRFEPMVIYVTGASGIGKSFMTEALVDILLKKTHVKGMATEKIFYRTAGERFWSGYRNQPVVVYDEWLNTRDQQRCMDQLAEMMKLKSTAMFIPEMAHLEEKRIRANPLIVVVLCNDAFPANLGDYVTCSEASLRRRELVIHAEQVPAFQGVNYRQATGEQRDIIKAYGHLQFGSYKDVRSSTSLSTIRKDFPTMSNWVANEWLNYWNRENENVRRRMQSLPHYAEEVDGPLSVRDPFSMFYQIDNIMAQDPTVSQNAWTPLEQLEEAIRVTSELLNRRDEEVVEEPELIPWELAQAPVVQIDGIGIAMGVATTGFGLQTILKATRTQLLYWEEDVVRTQMPLSECCICLADRLCVFECRDSLTAERPHRMCGECHRTNMEIGTGCCPLCRSRNIQLFRLEEQMQQCSFWVRSLAVGLKNTQSVISGLLSYYRFRDRHRVATCLLDTVMDMCYRLLSDDPVAQTGFTAVRMAHTYWHVGGEMLLAAEDLVHTVSDAWSALRPSIPPLTVPVVGVVQIDDDDDWAPVRQPVAGTSLMPDGENDVFAPVIDEAVLEVWADGKPMIVPCMHQRVLDQAYTVVLTGIGEDLKWSVADNLTHLMVDITVHACSDDVTCPLRNEERYKMFLNGYIRRKTASLRSLYVKLYRDPVEANYNVIPTIVRPRWFKPVEIELADTWWQYLSGAFENYKVTLYYLGAAITAVGVVMKVYQSASALLEPSGDVQISATAGSPEASARHRRNVVQRRGRQMSYFQAETGDNIDVFDAVMGKVARNTFKLILTMDGARERVMYGTGLFNHVLLIPRHYAHEIQKAFVKGGKLWGHPLNQPQTKAEIRYQADGITLSKEVDLAYLRLPTKFPLFKDLRKYIAVDADYNQPLPSSAVLLGNPKTGCDFIREIDVELFGIRYDQVVFDQDNKSFTTKEILVYNYSKAGCCGSLLLRENHQRPILSMHFAGIGEGLSGEGFGILLTQELLGDLAAMDTGVIQMEDVAYESIDKAKMVFDDTVFLTYYGSVPPEQTPYTPSKSKLVKSLIHGAADLEVPIEPAILSKTDARYLFDTTPLYEGVKKHGNPTQDFDQQLVDQAGEMYWDLCLSTMKPLIANPKKLTKEQAIVGIPGFNHYVGMDLTTSAGYPYCLNKQRTTKNQYIHVVRNDQQQAIGVSHIDHQILEACNTKRELRKQGIVPHTLFVDTLKDEKRPCEKVRSRGGTRVFCGSPVDYVIDCREYFLHFVAAFMDQRMNLMHSVGINPTSEEWTRLTNKLLVKNSRFCTIDYSNFGAGYNADVAKKGYELMIRWSRLHMQLGDEDERVMWSLVYECLQSMHICNNTVYQQGTGSPSGAFFTTVINTIVNILYLMIGWLKLTEPLIRDQPKLAAVEFKKNVELFCYGDDGIFAVTPEYVDVFNTSTLHHFFADYGIVSTSGDKYAALQATEAVTEAQFLKRGFKPHPTRQMWLSPLKEVSIKSATQWVWSSPNLKESTYINAEAALIQAHGHGPEYFAAFKNQVNRALIKMKCKPVTASWLELDHKFFTTGFEHQVDDFLNNTIY
nr:MAG: polyprotein [Totiviridae sp.]